MLAELSRLVAAGPIAAWLCLRHARPLGIAPFHLPRFALKTFNLSLCYLGFSIEGSFKELWGACRAALFSAAYDYASDIRGFSERHSELFREHLKKHVSPTNYQIALDLYSKDWKGTLDHEGLSRGVDVVAADTFVPRTSRILVAHMAMTSSRRRALFRCCDPSPRNRT
jgi:hypothetical protein